MKFVIEHLSKSFEKKKFFGTLILRLKAEKFMGCWGETVPERRHCLIA